MNTLLKFLSSVRSARRWRVIVPILLLLAFITAGVVYADVPNRVPVRGTVPNPGTQQQELGNITFPAPYNVFEFLVTCAACHGGTIDQQAGHFGNWSGTSMASAARDPVFRANQMIVNSAVIAATGKDGAGNMCMRCHSPNGWYSGRFDPTLGGAANGSTMIHSILASTDDEGIPCEMCHRTLGSVTYKRSDLDPMDAVWNMMAEIDDWPHSGGPYTDQDGDPTLGAGNPYGDTTLQIDDGMTYGGRYPGYVQPYWSDTPLVPDPQGYMGYSPGGPYTGQTYGIWPPGWLDPLGNAVGGLPAFSPDGTLPIQYDVPVGPPVNPDGTPCYQCQSVSLEHPTFGVSYVEQPEFCGSCHDLTIPVLNHGMPEQRTFTEWKYSAYGQDGPDRQTCQACHMPRLQQEYSDSAPVTLNADPVVSGWFPYAKSRTNTAFHKLAGANRDLPMMMTALYPEVDFEVIGGAVEGGGGGAGTGNDTRIFPGMLSSRDPMWQRNQRNTEVSLLDGVDVQIVSGPTYNATTLKWEVQVKVINQTGHRIPSGYPDGRRLWLGLEVKDSAGVLVYQSGFYDPVTATLYTENSNGSLVQLKRALTPVIDGDGANNAVMVYERVTGTCSYDPVTGDPTSCTSSPNLLNETILFDNRIPPFGFNYAQYRQAGVKFWNYDPTTLVPFEEAARFTNNWDIVTYTFSAPDNLVLNARAEAYWETHTREFMEFLRTNDTSTLRPEGPVRVWAPNYPLTPNYLSDEFGLADIIAQMQADGWLAPGESLNDNWGGIAYAAWYQTGKGEPYLVGADDSTMLGPPVAPTEPVTFLLDPFTVDIRWDPVADADGYLIWIKYGSGLTTASWDKLGIVYDDGNPATPLGLVNTAMNVAKTYVVKVQAFNGKGYSPDSPEHIFQTPMDLPFPPEQLAVFATTADSISLSWMDAADNEIGFVIERQDVPVIGNFYEIARIPSQTAGAPGFGGNNWTDTGLINGKCYNYRVAAYNASGLSTWNINGPVQGCTGGPPGTPGNLAAVAISGARIDLTWVTATGQVSGYRIERSTDSGATWPTTFNLADPTATSHSDLTVLPNQTYWYRVFAYNVVGNSLPSNVAQATTPSLPPTAPTNLILVSATSIKVDLAWTDNSNNETGFSIERSVNGGTTWAVAGSTAANVTTFSDNTVQPLSTYQYRVFAYNAGGPSAFTNVLTVVTPGQIPQAPSELTILNVTKNSISMSWRDNAANEQGYYVERSLNGATWSRVATLGINATRYTDKKLNKATTYYYRVQAFNADGVSAYSETRSATTKAK